MVQGTTRFQLASRPAEPYLVAKVIALPEKAKQHKVMRWHEVPAINLNILRR
jgi:hypothetical protein